MRIGFDQAILVATGLGGVSACLLAREEGREPVRNATRAETMRYSDSDVLFSAVQAAQLGSSGVLVLDDVLSPAQLRQARHDVLSMQNNGKFDPSPNLDESIRSDRIIFLTAQDRQASARGACTSRQAGQAPNEGCGRLLPGEGLLHVQWLLQGVAGALQDQSFKGFGTSAELDLAQPLKLRVPDQLQLAVYPASESFYVAHRDVDNRSILEAGLMGWLKSESYRTRSITAILYLNDTEWDAEHGGCLRCYLGAKRNDLTGESAVEVRDIDPRGGRLVVFDSQKVLHEVMPTHRTRSACTAWILTDQEWMDD